MARIETPAGFTQDCSYHDGCYWGGCTGNHENSSGVWVRFTGQAHMPCKDHLEDYLHDHWKLLNPVAELKNLVF